MTVETYDSKSYDLAERFLEDTPSLNTGENRHELAIEIQTAIEDFIADKTRSETSRRGQRIGQRMIDERQREIAVSLKALHMMQEHHGNRYFSFRCVSSEEERDWYAKAEKIIPQVSE